ncbi:MAG: TIGR00366 family protein [Bacteroidia bacterium]|nr:TIGR00366 family protein [Bacteroidia bacterium]
MKQEKQQTDKLIAVFKKILPSPFTIAIVLTLITLIIAQLLTKPAHISHSSYFVQLVSSWENGLWDSSTGGLYFAFQMMLILVLGHILALTPAVDKLIKLLLQYCTSTASSVVIVSIGAISLGLINWGLGLIFGAIIARKVGEKFAKENKALNYGLVGAAAYSTMMVWHGGLSGSATTKSMELGYIPEMMKKAQLTGIYPESIPFNETIGSPLNISVAISCLILIPTVLYFIAKKSTSTSVPTFSEEFAHTLHDSKIPAEGAERLDFSKAFGMGLGISLLIYGGYQILTYQGESTLGFIQLNFINFIFLGLSLTLHKTIDKFSKALQIAIEDVSGILIQFPFYFGILAIMQSSGLITVLSNAITQIANAPTLPFFTFISAGLINIFVPSGGGQWAVQGPIIIETTQLLGSDLSKTILAMAYGDQWTNMLQPFWALPLLGITKLKPQQVLPYSVIVMLVGFIIFSVGLLV